MDNEDEQLYHDTIASLKEVLEKLEAAGPHGFPAIIKATLPKQPLFKDSPMDEISIVFSIPWGG